MNLLHFNANELYSSKRYKKAIIIYSILINNNYKLDIMYSNRAACFLHLGNYMKSLNDSLKSVENNLNYAKGWARVGYSYKGLKMDNDAFKAFDIAYKFDKTNKLYQKEVEYYSELFTNKINTENIFNLLKDPKMFEDLKMLKNDVTSTQNVMNNKNVMSFIDNLMNKL
jgi:tetratricopeptide (TPR) repeat protein